MEAMREGEAQVLARRAPAPAMAMAEAREPERVAAAGAPARRRKFRGVTYMPSGKCSASINEPGSKKRTWLGTYTDEEVAACAYDLAARSLRGPKAKTNFEYPPPQYLTDAVTTAPGRRGPVYHVPPPPAPAATPPAAPAQVSFEHVDFSYKAPPSEPAQNPVYPFLKDLPKTFSIQAAVAASRRVSDPVDHFAPPIQIVAPATEPVPASSAETCFSSTPTTDLQLKASASSSWLMASNSRQLMLRTPKIFPFKFKTPKIFAVPTTPTPITSDEGFTGDNFTGINVPFYFTQTPSLPLSALMPLDVGALQTPQTAEGMGNGWPGIRTMV